MSDPDLSDNLGNVIRDLYGRYGATLDALNAANPSLGKPVHLNDVPEWERPYLNQGLGTGPLNPYLGVPVVPSDHLPPGKVVVVGPNDVGPIKMSSVVMFSTQAVYDHVRVHHPWHRLLRWWITRRIDRARYRLARWIGGTTLDRVDLED